MIYGTATEQAIRRASCTKKKAYSQHAAMALAERCRERGEEVQAYRCIFDGTHWHIGHCPSMRTFAQIARLIRERRVA